MIILLKRINIQFIFYESYENDESEQFICIKANHAHAKRKHNRERLQFTSFIVNEIFLFMSTHFIKNIAKSHARNKRNADVKNTIIKDCHEERTTIDSFFIINTLINKLIKYEINQSIKNFFDYLFLETCVKLRLIEKSTRCSRRDWKFMNLKKFEQYLETHLSKLLSKVKSEWQSINEYIELLLKSIEKTIKNFTS